MTFLRSVVVKLWGTILLLVSVVLFILTILLLEFFQNNNIQETKRALTDTAEKIAHVLEKHQNGQFQLGLEISWQMIDDATKVVIIKNAHEVYYSPNTKNDGKLTIADINKDPDLVKVFRHHVTVEKVSNLASVKTGQAEVTNYSIIGVPL